MREYAGRHSLLKTDRLRELWFHVTNSCNVTCAHTTVTAPKNGDGCCPPGANSNTDSDCSASCGNGVLESGEQCDPVGDRKAVQQALPFLNTATQAFGTK